MSGRFDGRAVVVTGGAHGIGRATVERFAVEGAAVVALDRDEAALARVERDARERGLNARGLVCDCTDEGAVRAAFAAVEQAHGAVDVLVNNVGGSAREQAGEFWESSPETWERVIRLSLVSCLLCSRAAVPAMRTRGSGCVVNVGSDASFVGDAGLADYAAAKFGVVGFTRALARELAPHGVRVNAVCPGAIATRAHEVVPAGVIARIRDATPLGFVGRPEQVAGVIAFLASEDAGYVTGQSILVDGGRWML